MVFPLPIGTFSLPFLDLALPTGAFSLLFLDLALPFCYNPLPFPIETPE